MYTLVVLLTLMLVWSSAVPIMADDPDELMPCVSVVVKPGRLAKFVCKPAAGGAFPLPTFVVNSGGLRIHDLLGLSDDDFPLDVVPWTGLGDPPGSLGWKYHGTRQDGDPCSVVLVKPTVVKGVCRGADVSLVTPFAGDAGIVLKVESLDSRNRYCARFGGREVRNDETALKRKKADAPGACSPSGAFLEP
jgi:hypothetical protein